MGSECFGGTGGGLPSAAILLNRYFSRERTHGIPASIGSVALMNEIFLLSFVPRFHVATHDHDGMNFAVILDMNRRRVGEDDLPRPISEVQLSGLMTGWLSAL
ncbi:hypothetical protein [Arthrobacter sp. AQ5-05]|uniref:hypothetical protein n=1 Tax=Arthrobacter sp. AQ5-05 TaxID=2184581 RepID=UPI0015EBBBAD|nr:hypothetical protein [Arthrobacter sp. AQ5-05]